MLGQRSLVHPRDEIMQTMERIYRYRMTTTSGGNLSIRDGNEVWITPARVDKGSLRREDIVRVREDGPVAGLHPPSSELPFHQAIYAARSELAAIVHAHPVALVAFSISGRLPDTRLFPQARHVCGQPGFAPYALPGSRGLGESIAHVFASGHNCVVLENHGVVVGGVSLEEAFQRFEALEFAARTMIQAHLLGPVRLLSDEQLAVADRRRVDLRPELALRATSHEKELRRQLVEFVHRGCQQRLLISTEGSLSARLDANRFVITPSQQDRYRLTINDLVLVEHDACEADKIPSRATRAHQAIYREHADVHAIIFAHPVNATAFAVSDRSLEARTIPESYLFLRDVPRAPFGLQYEDGPALAQLISLQRPAILLQNDGVLVVGRSVFDAFDRLEVLESTAEALIHGSVLGELKPMSEEVIRELHREIIDRIS